MVAEQALDTGIHIVRSCVCPGNLHDPILGLSVFQARYCGLCTIMYVYACYSTRSLISDQFARTTALSMFKP